MSKTQDIEPVIDNAPIGRVHVTVVGISILVGVADGFDNQALAFTAPSIAQDWGLTLAALAPVFSAGLAGMMIGSILFAEATLMLPLISLE